MAIRDRAGVAPHRVKDVQEFVVVQLGEARKRIQHIEKELVRRGRAHQKELEAVIASIRSGKQLKLLEKQASAASREVKKRIDALQTSVLDALGVASREEIRQIHRDLARLTKRVESLSRKPSA